MGDTKTNKIKIHWVNMCIGRKTVLRNNAFLKSVWSKIELLSIAKSNLLVRVMGDQFEDCSFSNIAHTNAITGRN